MQIPSGQWSSAAAGALPQQSARSAATPASASTPTTPAGIERVAEGDQSHDRDADEKYLGDGGRRNADQHDKKPPAKIEGPNVKAIELSANDPEPPSQFESWG